MLTRKLTAGTQYEQAQAYQLATAGRAWMLPEEVRDETGMSMLDDPTDLEPPVKVTERINEPPPAGAPGTEPGPLPGASTAPAPPAGGK